MRVLYLPIKREWFDMILAGVKKEEYREKSAHWLRRITYSIYRYGSFTHVCFINGYQKDSPRAVFIIKSITQGRGKKEWGADLRRNYFIIRIGKRWDVIDGLEMVTRSENIKGYGETKI